MSTDPGLCFLITNVCKPPKHFDFPEITQPFRFVWFEEFPLVCYSRWEDKSYCMPCILFGYENVGKSLQKTISNKEDSRKNINKTWKSSNRKTQKEANIISQIFKWIHIAPTLLHLFLKGENEKWVNWENWVGGRTNFSKTYHGKMGGERENAKFVSLMRCFCFNLHTINYHGNWYCLYFECMFVYYINQACN